MEDNRRIRPVQIQIQGVAASDADRYAGELESTLQAEAPGVKVERRSDETNTMDFGATLVLLLGTSSAIAVARGIRAWLMRRPNASLTIGELTINSDSKDLAAIVEKALRR